MERWLVFLFIAGFTAITVNIIGCERERLNKCDERIRLALEKGAIASSRVALWCN